MKTFETILDRETEQHVEVTFTAECGDQSNGYTGSRIAYCIDIHSVKDLSGANVETTEEENEFLEDMAAKQLFQE